MTDVTTEDAAEPELSAADEQLLRELTERARAGGLKLTGEGGLLGKLTRWSSRAPWKASWMTTSAIRGDSTGKPSVTYCPGGTRPAAEAGMSWRRRNPRAMGNSCLRIRFPGRLAPAWRQGECAWLGMSSPEVSRLNTVSMEVSSGAEPASSSAMRPSVRCSASFKLTGFPSAAAECSHRGPRVLVLRRRVHGRMPAAFELAERARNRCSPAPR